MKIGSETIHYKIEKGTVLNIESRSENTVSGHNGVHVVNGTFQSSFERSRTIHHQKIYLEDEEGKAFAIDLADWNLSAMSGNTLIAINTQSSQHSGYAMIYNKTLDRVYCGYLQKYFRIENETDRKGRLLFAIIIAIAFPTIAYTVTKSEDIGALTSITALIFIIFVWRRNRSSKQKGMTLPLEMKKRLQEILSQNA
ncbi:hypothetical protein [Flavobacterium sp.]|uniref:hypothetical protein n=1 Tax=Flavobacterium sp. TaxID=239 RepID=UPI0039E229D1